MLTFKCIILIFFYFFIPNDKFKILLFVDLSIVAIFFSFQEFISQFV